MNPLAVCYGGGVNSNAMLVEFKKRGITPDIITFADTGGERPDTYKNIRFVSEWCKSNGFPEITIVRATGKTLEQDCIERKSLPSLAFGFKTCSLRWKAEPQNRIHKLWSSGRPYFRAFGFDAGEERRRKPSGDDLITNVFPLIDWGIFREDCISICEQAGLPYSKSSCFFCPAMKRHEIIALSKRNPDLFQRAVAIEQGAKTTTPRGLGGHGKFWEQIVKNENAQYKFEDFDVDEPCGCYDG